MPRFFINDSLRPSQCSPVAEYGTQQTGRSVYTEAKAHRDGRRIPPAQPWPSVPATVVAKSTAGPASVVFSTAGSIPSANYVGFNVAQSDDLSLWNAATKEWVAPADGVAVVTACARGSRTRPSSVRVGMYVVKNGVLVATNMQGSGGGNSDTEATVYNAYGTALVDVVAGDRIAVALLDLTGAWSHARLVDIDCMMSVGFVPLSSGASYVYARRSADLTLTPVALATAAPFPFNSEVVDTHNEFDDATGVFTASRRCLVLAVAAVGVGAASTSSSPAYALVLCKHDATDAVVDYAGGEVYERMFPDTVTLGFGLRAEGMFFLEPGEKVSAKVHLMHGTATARLFNGASVNQQTLQRFHVLALPIL